MAPDADDGFDAATLQYLFAKTLYALRESRKALLAPYAVDAEAVLLARIAAGTVAPHPAYEHYLGALIIEQTRNHLRAQVAEQLGGAVAASGGAGGADSQHPLLKERIEREYADRLGAPVQQAQDALVVSFDTGLMVELRYFSADEYSIGWAWGDAELRIDTAPAHPSCASAPHHLHDDAAQLHADPLSVPGTPCWTNLKHLIDVLLVDPLLEHARSDTGASPCAGAASTRQVPPPTSKVNHEN